MNRTSLRLLGFAAVGGFAVGWLMFARPAPEAAPPPLEAAPPPEARAESSRKEFPLLPLDVEADRETPAVAVDGQGRVVLAWASQTGDLERTIMLARSADGGKTFDTPLAWRKVPIYKYSSKSKNGKEVTYSTHVLPRLVASKDSIVLGWVEAVDGGPKVVFQVATSADGGRTFPRVEPAHGPESVKPGFTGLGISPEGSVLCAWLDGRSGGQRPYLGARYESVGEFPPEQLVYEGPGGKGVCPCCDVAVVQGYAGSTYVAFRDNDGGNRDIVVTMAKSGEPGFSKPTAVTPDHWKLDGCPHDGPSMTLSPRRLDIAWMDAHTGKNRVYHASTPTSGLAFAPREIAPNSPGPQGHPKLAALPSGGLVAIWDEAVGWVAAPSPPAVPSSGHGHASAASLPGAGRSIQMAISTPEGVFGEPRAVAPRAGAFSLQPSLAIAPDGTILAVWNELDSSGKRVVFARVGGKN